MMRPWRAQVGLIRYLVAAVVMAGVAVVSAPRHAMAIPTLQLYVEGSTYDPATETWTAVGNNFRLWVLGNVGGAGPIEDVRLTAAFDAGLRGVFTITPATASPGLLPSPGDPSVPAPVALVSNPASATSPSGACGSNGTVGTIPCMSDARPLPSHGEFGAGVQWLEWDLGDMTATDSPVGDFILGFPTEFPSQGQINVYDITVSGFPAGTVIHFDAFDHIQSGNKSRTVFAPFSHDAQSRVPAPAALTLVGSALAGVAVFAGARRLGQLRQHGSRRR